MTPGLDDCEPAKAQLVANDQTRSDFDITGLEPPRHSGVRIEPLQVIRA